jgi:two-component system, chemotaxis family, protein-glutamate methylesterase/glutaminase
MELRILIVDDTITYRKILSDIVKEVPEAVAIGTAPSGIIALKKLAQEHFDIVFLDVHMPDMDGVETLKRIKKEFPGIAVVMVSGVTTRGADTTIEALQLGAVDFIRKPDSADAAANAAQLKNDIISVFRLIKLKSLTSATGVGPGKTVQPSAISKTVPRESAKVTTALPRSFGVCVIGVSTGGPEALSKLVPGLTGPFSVPILCVQHMPPMFTKSLADSLTKKSKIQVVEGTDNEPVQPGVMYLAPGGRHMVVRKSDGRVVLGINDGPPANSCRPSVDVLFRSIASVYGDRGILAAVLTGMGNDGCNGVRTLKRQGCYCITQSEQSCVVYGMPRAVDEAGLSDKSIPLEEISREIEILLTKGRMG